MWVFAEKVHLMVSDSRKTLTIANLELREGDMLPKGSDVNAELANPESALRREAQRIWTEGGKINLGSMRVLNGGGVYGIPASFLDFSNPDAGTHEALKEKVLQKFGGTPELAFPVVFRDWGAPGTSGVWDGGGAGRGEELYYSPQEFLVKKCLGENLGEIGVLVQNEDGVEGRLDYFLRLQHSKTLNEWLSAHIIQEWRTAHGSVPLPACSANIKLESLPDKVTVEGMGTVDNVKLAIEWHSASVECLTLATLSVHVSESSQTRLRFLDIDHRSGRGMNRRIGVILKQGEKLTLISYDKARFDNHFPMMPITLETIFMCGNEKFAAVVEMIRAL